MTIPNRITLDDIATMEISAIAALPAAELALLVDEARDALERAKRLKDWVEGAIDIKYGARAAGVRHSTGKDTGTVRFDDGGTTVVADLPKKVQWDQAKLAAIVAEIRSAGEDPDEYLTTEFKVSERAYGAWPSSIRSAFEPARTVTTGKPTYQFIRTEEK